MHLNPPVHVHVNRFLGNLANVSLISPKGRRNFVRLMSRCRLVLTDSGGFQERRRAMASARNPYGDGYAAGRIVERIRNHFALVIRLLAGSETQRANGAAGWARPRLSAAARRLEVQPRRALCGIPCSGCR